MLRPTPRRRPRPAAPDWNQLAQTASLESLALALADHYRDRSDTAGLAFALAALAA